MVEETQTPGNDDNRDIPPLIWVEKPDDPELRELLAYYFIALCQILIYISMVVGTAYFVYLNLHYWATGEILP